VELITTGFDLSSQVGRNVPVETVILLRPTMSLALYIQMVGRALRRKPYPAIILDHAGNVQRHGLPDDEREWSLEGRTKATVKKAVEVRPPLTCEGCFNQIRRPAPQTCPHCGAELGMKARKIEETEGNLVEIDDSAREALRLARKKEQANAQTLEELIALGTARGYKNPTGWAKNLHEFRNQKQMRYRYGTYNSERNQERSYR
jgi:superfamily II DNA or RNA helicase